MNKPNFFIVGAAKAGTTSLYHYLEQHPEIGMASYKEPCFFCENQFYISEDDYYKLYSHIPANIEVVGEASTNYLAAPESPKLIKHNIKNSKIIILLRHPVDRAFSLYKWMVRAGFEGSSTFEEALALEEKRKLDERLAKSPVKYNYNYFASGLYYEQILRYFDSFDKENILIINFEDLKANTNHVLKTVFDFLKVSVVTIQDTKIFNKAKYPLSAKAQFFFRNNLYNIMNPRDKNKMFGNFVVDVLAGINSNLGKEPKLNSSTAKVLQQRFNVDLLKLSKIIDFSIDRWLTKY